MEYRETANIFPVKNMRIAGELMSRGFILIRTQPDENNRWNLFVFKNTPQIIEAFNDILAKRKK